MKNRMSVGKLGLFLAAGFGCGLARASSPGTPILLANPTHNADVGAETKEIVFRWSIDPKKKVSAWETEVWCASDGKCLYKGEMKPKGVTNELKVAGFEPHKVYYWKVARNWVRSEECVFTTGTVPAPKAATFPSRFADASRYDIVDMPRGEAYDLGLTRFRGFTRVNIDRERRTEFVTCVPCEQYAKAYVLCKVDPAKGKDPCFNLRLTRIVNAPWKKFKGRAVEAMVNVLVDLAKPGAFKVSDEGDYKLVEVPLDMGDIQDIVFTDQRGDFLETRGRYLDLELMGRVHPRRDNGFCDRRCDTDPAYTSAVTVYGVALEKCGAELEVKAVRHGNVFMNDERPEAAAEIRIRKPGAYVLSMATYDIDGQPLATSRRTVTATGTVTNDIPLGASAGVPGWYRLVWQLTGPDGATVTHNAACALLGEDTRTTEMGEQYASWIDLSLYAGHYTPSAKDPAVRAAVLDLYSKAGFRRAFDIARMVPLAERQKYRIGESSFARFPNDWSYVKNGGETNLVAELKRRLKENPHCKSVMFFHEHARKHGAPPEIFGFEPDAARMKLGKDQAEEANKWGAFVRKYFPEAKIMVGNSLCASEFIAELIRHGFKEEYADSCGMEVMGNEALPEYQDVNTIQGAELMLLTARHFGYKWGVNQCFESNFRMDLVSGVEEQASFYVRDVFLAYLWGMSDICIGGLANVGNHYALSAWGNDGFCTRWPFHYPKPSYAAVATVTKMLDRVTGVRKVPTGDECVYAVEFARADGRAVTAFWTSRGECVCEVEKRGGGGELVDMYGTPQAFDGKVVASKRIKYLMGKPGDIGGVRIVKRTFPDDVPPVDYRVVARTDTVEDWFVAREPIVPLNNVFNVRGWPHRTFTAAELRAVEDPEMGRCLELELPDDGQSVCAPHVRYNALMLKKPIPIRGAFKSLGCTVKGNSGWGEVYYILEDAQGRRSVSCDTGAQGKLDTEGKSVLDFTGWNFLRFPLKDGSSVPEQKVGKPTWNWTDPQLVTRDGLKLVGLGFAARMKPLFLNEAKTCRQVLRVKDIGVFD